MKSKMVLDTYESAAKARPRAALLNKACVDFPEEMEIIFTAMKAAKGFSVWAEFDKAAYPTFSDVETATRTASIAYRKAKREEDARRSEKAAK